MSHSYSSNRIHLIFSTKNREKRLTESLREKLWPYMAGIARNHGFEAIKIGGVANHVHSLLLIPPTISLSKAIQTFKACSSKWLNETDSTGKDFAWQEGYGAFSVSASHTDNVIAYIANRAIHHAKQSYEEEFIELLSRHGIAYDLVYVFG